MKIALVVIIAILLIAVITVAVVGAIDLFDTEAKPTPTPTPTPVEIADAIDTGLVVAYIRGTGASSGDSIEITFDLKVDVELEIIVPRGTHVITSGAAQSMVIMGIRGIVTGPTTFRPVTKIKLQIKISTSDTYLFEAYCIDFHKDNPSYSTTFSVKGPVSETLQAILACGDDSGASIGAIQAAIWAVNDDVSETELLSRFSVTSSELESARGLIECAGVDANRLRLFQ